MNVTFVGRGRWKSEELVAWGMWYCESWRNRCSSSVEAWGVSVDNTLVQLGFRLESLTLIRIIHCVKLSMFKRILSRISTLAVVAGSVLAPSALRAQEALLEETFAGGSLGLWRAVSVASNEDWEASERDGLTFAEANGFGADEPSDDWLVSPVIDFDLS